MSARTIKRGGKSARKVAAAHGKAQKVRSARARTGSAFDTVMAWLPFSEGQLHRIFLAMILGLVAVGVWL
ncbi:MAG: cell division protein FtsQ, partial [Novosphingobium sp.]|nr:cell division protein FtsQ [Novosphingobium sp.]